MPILRFIVSFWAATTMGLHTLMHKKKKKTHQFSRAVQC